MLLHSASPILPLCILLGVLGCTAANSTYGTFQNPSIRVRPRFRYWLPDSSVDANIVKKDIAEAGSVGAGGVEYLPFFGYGGAIPSGADWSTYGFGTPAFKQQFIAALQVHHEHGLSMDFALGPNQGQGVPAYPSDEGLMWDLSPYYAEVQQSGMFDDTLPGCGSGELVAAVSALVVSKRNSSIPTQPGRAGTWYLDFVLKDDSLEDLSGSVSASGSLTYNFTATQDSNHYGLFVFYQRHTLTKNLDPMKAFPKTIFDYGSYTVDHFSARGAQVVIDFWEQHLLSDDVKSLLREVGHVGWEDSVELLSNISWSPSIPARFESLLGYSIKPYLPLIMFGNNNINIQSGSPGKLKAALDSPDRGLGYNNDFRRVLQNGYQEYLTTLSDWLNSTLGLGLSSQVSYNLPMDMEASIPYVQVPECESLQFSDRVDAYRQFSGSAYLAGKPVVSVELGAVFGLAYQYTLNHLVFAVNRCASGGVNAFVIHGQTYTGNYFNTTWPGYTSFGYHVSDMYSEKRPDWNHGMRGALDYISRVEWSEQQGTARIDVAIFNRQSATDPVPDTLYLQNDLLNAGWSYVYISPENFDLPQAYVRSGTLAPNGPAFKAMVVPSTQNMTLNAVNYLRQYAQSGLPILITGGSPGYYASGNSSDMGTVEDAVAELLKQQNVYSIDLGSVAQQLSRLGLVPNAGFQTNGTWYTTWREDVDGGVDYLFVFGDTNSSSGELQVPSSKQPWELDLWTGEVKPLLNYSRFQNGTAIPLSLNGNQTSLIAFTDRGFSGLDKPPFSMENLPSSVLGYNYSRSNGLSLHVPAMSSAVVELSDGRQLSINGSGVPQPFQLTNWTLVAEHWEAPANFSDSSRIASKRNTSHQLDELVSWLKIPALANVSGLGYYSTNFQWPPESEADRLGAYIQFPPVLNAILVWINGQSIRPLDYTNPSADITPYLVDGENDVLAVVPTTMLNYLLTLLPRIRNIGTVPSSDGGPYSSIGNVTDNGLIGTVQVIPYKTFCSN